MNGKVTYRQQFTRCGKQRCRKCKEGSGHGPYWYAYWSENGRTVSKYIGAVLPEQLQKKKLQVILLLIRLQRYLRYQFPRFVFISLVNFVLNEN